jgi:hypothetical protein
LIVLYSFKLNLTPTGFWSIVIVQNTSCPIDYRYSLPELACAPEKATRVLYVVGGLYGNPEALRELSNILNEEPDAEVVFNGDFNWFNIDPGSYIDVNEFVLAHTAIRGNVETELVQTESRGCGCSYPGWVAEEIVAGSNTIIEILRSTAGRYPELSKKLTALPRFLVYRIGATRIGVVHGDAQSLSGWGFSQENLADPTCLDRVKSWFIQTSMDVYACSHTCLPVLKRLDLGDRVAWVMNNGAAGMPNFKNSRYGLVTRIADRPCRHVSPVYGATHAGLYLDAIALNYDHQKWQARFSENWPEGTAAHQSYYSRITAGPDYRLEQALRLL